MRKPVATIDGAILTVADLEGYLRDNLPGEEGGEPVTPDEQTQVKSRLFENFIDEEILLAEARRRGARVTAEELASYLDAGADETPGAKPPGEEHRRMALKNLTIQKLREASALKEASVTPAEVDAYLARNRESLREKPEVVLRSFPLASPSDAGRLRKKILAMKRKLDRAARTGEELGPDAGQLQRVSPDALPDELKAALAKLEPGELTPVVTLDGNPYLFYYPSGPAGLKETEDALRSRARDALVQAKVDEAASRLLDELKRKARVELFPGNLPFRYVPEEDRDPAGGGAPSAKGQD
jgi:parvulin-like peptidyl-prolyl isomerase